MTITFVSKITEITYSFDCKSNGSTLTQAEAVAEAERRGATRLLCYQGQLKGWVVWGVER